MSESIDYSAVLADLKSQRDRIENAIQGIEAMLGLRTPDASPGTGEGPERTSKELTEDSFLGMSAGKAAVLYLRMMKKPQTTPQIAAALKLGGIHSSSDNFNNMIYTALRRQPDVLRLGMKWGLKEFHPGARPSNSKRAKPGDAALVDESDVDAEDGEA